MRNASALAAKISAYSTLASALISSQFSDAQIIRETVNETLTPFGEHALPIDLNGDGRVDVTMALQEHHSDHYFKNNSFLAIPENGASIIYTTAHYGGVAALGSNFAISNQLPSPKRWDINSFMAFHYFSEFGFFYYTEGPWAHQNRAKRFVGIRINKDGQYYYGWVRCKINIATESDPKYDRITIVDFAINQTPNKKIYTGARPSDDMTDNKEALESGSSDIIYASGKSVYLNLSDNNLIGTNLSIYNIQGAMVYSETMTALDHKIDLIYLSAGIYVATLENSARRKSYKVVLQ